MEDGVILDSNSTISLDDCPPWTREKMELATNFTFWAEGIIQVMKKNCLCVMDIISVVKVFVMKQIVHVLWTLLNY